MRQRLLPLFIAHRGMPRRVSENTIASFMLALDARADGIELDVHATSDGTVLVHHDPDIPGLGSIASQTFAELQAGCIERDIPLLRDVLLAVNGRAELFVELKGEAMERDVLSVIQAYDGCLAIHSFDHPQIERLHALNPGIRLGVLLDAKPPSLADLLEKTGARDVWPEHSLADATLTLEAHRAGARVIPWTVNDEPEMLRLVALGVDGVCGDDVGALRRAYALAPKAEEANTRQATAEQDDR